MPAVIAACAAIVMAGLIAPRAVAQDVITRDEALAAVFPSPAMIERRTAFLDEAQLERARALAGQGVNVDHSVVTYYVGRPASGPVTVAYFDAHRVRTLPEALMVLVDTNGTIGKIRVLKFSEPPEYRPPDGWLDRFVGRVLDDDLRLKRAIDGITGATLTSDAVTDATRRVLALHAVIDPLGDEP